MFDIALLEKVTDCGLLKDTGTLVKSQNLCTVAHQVVDALVVSTVSVPRDMRMIFVDLAPTIIIMKVKYAT
jgi:hypothetical protein